MRTHFARFLTPAQLREVEKMLTAASGVRTTIDTSSDFFEVKCPDGDIAVSGVRKGHGYICRLHKEVFDAGY